jgi:hypothetical protein
MFSCLVSDLGLTVQELTPSAVPPPPFSSTADENGRQLDLSTGVDAGAEAEARGLVHDFISPEGLGIET